MNGINTIFSHPWSIKLPPLVRYIDNKYVEAFFKDGSLRIPSFIQFRKHTDEQRGDLFEGRAFMEINSPNAHHAACMINGQEVYVLSASTIESQKLKEECFKTDSSFRILNSLAFADCISHYIPGFIGGYQGLCFYRDDILITKQDNMPFRSPDTFSNPEEWAAEYDKYIGKQSDDSFFIKHSKYSHQGEYRFIWFAQGCEKDYLNIKCPEATKYCEKL